MRFDLEAQVRRHVGGAPVVAAVAAAIVAVALAGVPEAQAGASAVAVGWSQTCALTSGGGVKCWGYNETGAVGDGTTAERLTPTQVTGLASGVVAVAAGGEHTCALTMGGGVQCWGKNQYGQLGDGSQFPRLTPMQVVGLTSGVVAVAASAYHTCALTMGGGVKCWGANSFGQLGDGSTTDRLTPVQVVGLGSGVAAVAAGGSHTCALTTGGGVQCWGWNPGGQLGDGSTTNRLTPVQVVGLGSGVVAVASGLAEHTCALTTGGGVQCWGWNFAGQLGDGSTTDRLTPVQVRGLGSGVVAVAAGEAHSCALTTGGRMQCWGLNYIGQLGDGTTTDRLTPVDVSGLGCGDGVVDPGEACDGGTCCAADCVLLATGAECRSTAGACDAAERCDGASAECPTDQLAPDGTECRPGGPCTSGACQAGVCEAAAVTPRSDCRAALRPFAGKFTLKDSVTDLRDDLGWAWKVGPRTTVAELGEPDQAGGAAYAVCVYDESGPAPELLLSAEVAPGVSWVPLGVMGYKFSDRAGAQGGITQILIWAGEEGRASVKVKGRGAWLEMPALPLGLPARVQVEVAGGVCFEATYSAAGKVKNDSKQFQGLSD